MTKPKRKVYQGGMVALALAVAAVPAAVSAQSASDSTIEASVGSTISIGSVSPVSMNLTPGAHVSVKKVNLGKISNIMVSGGALIDDLSSIIIEIQWQSQDFFSDGVQWYRV